MIKFLTTRGAISEIENIINNAKNVLVLISPFIRIPETLFQSIQVADRKDVKTTIVYGKQELKPDVLSSLRLLNNLSLFYNKDLHAKCYFNEESMVITSLNLYDYSENHNLEMGILVSSRDDDDIYDKAKNEVKKILKFATPIELKKPRKRKLPTNIKKVVRKPKKVAEGHCIRCNNPIKLDKLTPLCASCYKKWKIHGNPEYKEKYCHNCGKRRATNIEYPLCDACYRKSIS